YRGDYLGRGSGGMGGGHPLTERGCGGDLAMDPVRDADPARRAVQPTDGRDQGGDRGRRRELGGVLRLDAPSTAPLCGNWAPCSGRSTSCGASKLGIANLPYTIEQT